VQLDRAQLADLAECAALDSGGEFDQIDISLAQYSKDLYKVGRFELRSLAGSDSNRAFVLAADLCALRASVARSAARQQRRVLALRARLPHAAQAHRTQYALAPASCVTWPLQRN
jgi:hypothetical protein